VVAESYWGIPSFKLEEFGEDLLADEAGGVKVEHTRGCACPGCMACRRTSWVVGDTGVRLPPDRQDDGVKTVAARAELLCAQWV
jgi:hypothetical protein